MCLPAWSTLLAFLADSKRPRDRSEGGVPAGNCHCVGSPSTDGMYWPAGVVHFDTVLTDSKSPRDRSMKWGPRGRPYIAKCAGSAIIRRAARRGRSPNSPSSLARRVCEAGVWAGTPLEKRHSHYKQRTGPTRPATPNLVRGWDVDVVPLYKTYGPDPTRHPAF